MKILIYGDPHVNKYPQGLVSQRQDTELKLFERIYNEIVPEHEIDMCVCLGDFLHNSYLPASDMEYVYRILQTMTRETVILTGNHDRSDDTNSTIYLFDKLNPNITVVKGYYCTTDDVGKFHVFASYNYLKQVPSEALDKADYLYTHEEYPGFIVNTSGYKTTNGYKFSDGTVKQGLIVFNGHIHHRGEQSFNNSICVYNPGAISPVAFGELELYDYPCAYILDTNNPVRNIVKLRDPILPLTCNVEQYDSVMKVYYDDLSHVRLRVLYKDDMPELKGTEKFLSVEYKKLLSSSLDNDNTVVTEVEDIVVSVPQYIDEYVSDDKSLSDTEKSEVKTLCENILSKV